MFGEIDGGDFCILGGSRIQVVHPKEGFTVGFSWSDRHPIFLMFLLYMMHMLHVMLYILPDCLAVGPGSAPRVRVIVPDMYGTHLKYRQYLQSISFNNFGPQLARVVGIVWDASTVCDNYCSLTQINNKIESYIDIVD